MQKFWSEKVNIFWELRCIPLRYKHQKFPLQFSLLYFTLRLTKLKTLKSAFPKCQLLASFDGQLCSWQRKKFFFTRRWTPFDLASLVWQNRSNCCHWIWHHDWTLQVPHSSKEVPAKLLGTEGQIFDARCVSAMRIMTPKICFDEYQTK